VTTEPRPPTLTILLLLSAALLVAFFSGYELLDRTVLVSFGVFIAAILLPKKKALGVTLMTASALTFLVLGELSGILPHAAVRLMPSAAHNPVFALARLTSILAVMFLTSYFTTMVMDRLRESEAGLEGVIEAAGFGMLVVDARGHIAWMNQRLGAWMSWDDSIIGKECPHDHAEARVCFACAALETLASGVAREREVRDDTPRHFRHATFPVRNSSGEVVQAVHVVEEITSRKELESQALHTSGLAILGQLAAGVAHEIGNPLSSLHARLQLMKRHPDPAAIAESLEVLEKQIDRIGRIVRGVSHLARNRFDSRGVVDADAVVREAIALVKIDRRAARVDIRDELQALPAVRGIRDELLQVVLNLLFNAVEAMPDGGSITARTFANDGHVRIAISDSGPGIGDAVRARLFEPFFTTKHDGTGLGLSICRSLVHANGGTIEVESEPGRGAQFTIVLPVWSAAIA
jgi:signal transduction histidine kinase